MQKVDTEYVGLKSFTFNVTDVETPPNQLTISFTQVPSTYVNVRVNGILSQTGVSYPITSNFQIETINGTSINNGTDTLKWIGYDKNGGNTGEKKTDIIWIDDY